MTFLPFSIRLTTQRIPIHPPVTDGVYSVTFCNFGCALVLEVGQRLGNLDGRATRKTPEFVERCDKFARAVKVVHGTEQINPYSPRSGRTEGKGGVFPPVSCVKGQVRQFRHTKNNKPITHSCAPTH